MATLYHCNDVPMATKLAIVAELQKVCPDAVGAPGAVFIVTETNVLKLSQEFTVCDT